MNYEDDEDGMKGMMLFLPWSHVANFNSMAAIFQGPLGPGSLQVDESHVERSFQLFAAKVQAVHQEVRGGGGRWDNSNSIPKIVVGLSQVG